MHIRDVYETFSAGLRELPAAFFAHFVSVPSPLPEVSLVSLLRGLLEQWLPTAAPDPEDVDPDTDADYGVSAPILQKCYLPFAANTSTLDANVKMSLVVEGMFRLVWVFGDGPGLSWTPALQAAVDRGIRARNERWKPRKAVRYQGDGDDSAARDILSQSGQRLQTMTAIIKIDKA